MKIQIITTLLVIFRTYSAFAVTDLEIVQNIARNVILQDYLDLTKQAEMLHKAALKLSVEQTQENLELAQKAWRNARTPWESSESFLFGPVDSLGLDPGVDTWPLNKIDLQAVLGSNRQLTVDFVRNLGVNLQGFHTAEYLLFGEGIVSNKKNILNLTAREIEYLLAVTALLAEKTKQISNAWLVNADPENPSLPGYVEIIANPSAQNPIYPSEQAVLIEYTKGMIAILDEVANGKMSDPLGADISQANAALEESPFSWNSVADFSNNVRSALNVYTGDYAGQPGPGLIDFVARKNPTLAKGIETQLRLGIKQIMEIAGAKNISFGQAILDEAGRIRIKAAIDHLNSLRIKLETEVLPLIEG